MIVKVSDWVEYGIKISDNIDGQLKETQLKNIDGISYDLHINGIDIRDNGARLYQMGAKYSLKPSTCVVLETKENIETGNKVFGQICSRASLAAKGLIVSNLKVDPNYNDTLHLTVFNAGVRDIELKLDDAFCSLFFSLVESETTIKAKRPNTTGVNPNWWHRFKKEGVPILAVITSIATLLLLSLKVYEVIKNLK